MKNKLIPLIAILFFSFHNYAQVTLEKTYSVANKLLYLSEISEGEYKFILHDGDTIRLYNLDHTVYKKFRFKKSTAYQNSNSGKKYLFYISKTLFDCDSTNIEYLITTGEGAGFGNLLEIYRENGDTLFMDSKKQLATFNSSKHPFGFRHPIIQTPDGAKMIVENQVGTNTNGELLVYSLCGSLTTNLYPNSMIIANDISTKAYPNPFKDRLTIDYDLLGSKNGLLEVFDSSGKSIAKYSIDNTFNSVKLDVSQYSSGNYYYTITSSDGKRISKKIIRVD